MVRTFAASFLKIFVMAVYAAWSVKLAVIETDMNPLFTVPMVLLSIYGLWAIVQKAFAYLDRASG